ncbi:MAG: DNA repair protein RadC [Gammaproteobacteria bacterium]|nr:DNA repair protein RadC [Gammaproteobacteria bacterium]
MTITQWPQSERPREKLLKHGPSTLSDAELLAIFLRTGSPGETAVDLARDLLNNFGGLRNLLTADRAELSAVRGLGPAKSGQLQAILEVARRYLAERWQRGESLSSPRDVTTYLQAVLRDRGQEIFCALFLDTRHCVLAFEELFHGTIDGATVHPREVVRRALRYGAAAVIVAHNHPSGVAEPSRADEALTRRLKDALALMDIRLLDHLVIGDSETVSLNERGSL